MARPQKKGLDYFPIDVSMDRTNDDIEMLEAKYVENGFKTIIKLYMKIYGDEGYYLEWNEKAGLLLAKRVNADINEVNSIINDLVQWGVFDKEMFDTYGILTSKRVQVTYLDATRKRKDVEIIEEYLLTEIVNDNINLVKGGIYPQSKVNKSKVNKSKVNNNTIPPLTKHKYGTFKHVLLTEKEYQKLKTDFPDYDQRIQNLDDYLENKNVSYKNHNLTIRNWAKKDKASTNKPKDVEVDWLPEYLKSME